MASFMNNFDTYLVAEGESRDWKLILAQLSNFTVFKNMDEGLQNILQSEYRRWLQTNMNLCNHRLNSKHEALLKWIYL